MNIDYKIGQKFAALNNVVEIFSCYMINGGFKHDRHSSAVSDDLTTAQLVWCRMMWWTVAFACIVLWPEWHCGGVSGVASQECTDFRGRVISHGLHYVPGPDTCTLCVCDNGIPKVCKAVLCSPPQVRLCYFQATSKKLKLTTSFIIYLKLNKGSVLY